MNDADLDKFRLLLIQQRDELKNSLQMAQQSTETVELDQASVGRVSRGDALQAQSMAVETSRLKQQQLRKISMALSLIESGDYGYCSICDQDIDHRRLEVDPAATMCVPCASKQE
jgi:RNA polymerase-binding transcription factor